MMKRSRTKASDGLGGTTLGEFETSTKDVSQTEKLSKSEERANQRALWRKKVMIFIEHPYTQIIMTVITIYSLFFDDIRLVWFPKSSDDVFFGLTLFSFICFTLEIILASLSIDGYFNSFFFWLDIVSTITMIPDCGWIWYALTREGNHLLSTNRTTDLAKTTRSSRVTRIIRIIRLMRLFRIVKLYKQIKAAEKQRLQAINEQRSESRILRKKNIILA
jgi:hypothetical protein